MATKTVLSAPGRVRYEPARELEAEIDMEDFIDILSSSSESPASEFSAGFTHFRKYPVKYFGN